MYLPRCRLINGPYGIYARDASHNYYELITTHDNYETGFQLQGSSSNNTVIYLDSYRNRDPRKNGESADGFACKEGSGEGNVLRMHASGITSTTDSISLCSALP